MAPAAVDAGRQRLATFLLVRVFGIDFGVQSLMGFGRKKDVDV